MTTIKDLVFAIDETQKKFPENRFSSVYAQIIDGIPRAPMFITSNNGARDIVKNTTPSEIVEILCQEIVKIYNYASVIKATDPDIAAAKTFVEQYNVLSKKCPGYDTVSKLVSAFSRKDVNAIAYLLENNKALLDALHIVDKYYYDFDQKYRQVLEKYGDAKKLPIIADNGLKEKIAADAAKLRGVRNVQVNMHAVNRCYDDIMRGIQVRNKYNDYAIGGNLFATQHVGRKRTNQEDSVLIMEHPQNKDFKILVVSDGMGGGIAGEDVSSYTVREIAKWFEKLDPNLYNQPEIVQQLFNRKIVEINKYIFDKYNDEEHIRAGATFTGAIVTRNQTVITQIGDSRAYIIKNGNLLKRENISLVTKDESFTWPYDRNYHAVDPANIPQAQLEDIKFAHGGNRIIRCIGDRDINPNSQSFLMPNESYDKLLLMSDGASDLLSFEGIKIICRKTPWTKVTSLLVEAAIRKRAIRGVEWDEFYEKLANGTLTEEEVQRYNNIPGHADEEHAAMIEAGKDNTTVAGYFRR